MGFLIDLISSAGFGSIIGLAGGLFTKWMEHKSIQEKNNHEINMMNARKNLMVETAKIGMETAEVAGKLAIEQVEAKAFEVSQKTSGFGKSVKAIMRPIIIVTLGYFTWDIYTTVDTMVGGLDSLPSDDLINIYKIIILSILSLFTMGVSWYFAQRSSKQFDKLTSGVMK